VPLRSRFRLRTGDSKLILRKAAEDPQAFAAFYEEHAQSVLIFIARQVPDVEVALELMSEAFAVALEKCGQCRAKTPEEEVGWMYALVRTQISRYWRAGRVEQASLARLGVQPAALSDPEIERIEHLAGIDALARRVGPAMASLPHDQREAVQLRIVDGLTYPEVAAKLEVTEQVVRARVSRGLRSLAKVLQAESTQDGAGD